MMSLLNPLLALLGLAAAALAGNERNIARIAGGALFAAPAAYYAPPTVAAVLIDHGWLASLPPGGSIDGITGLIIGTCALRLLDTVPAAFAFVRRRLGDVNDR